MNPLGITTTFEEAMQSPAVRRHMPVEKWGRPFYLATPYTNRRDKARAVRQASEWQRQLGLAGFSTISPVVMGHHMRIAKWGHEEWLNWCFPFLCALQPGGGVVVPPIEGREISSGVRAEVCWATERNVPVFWG